ncbi:GNAT family N-acetyltransferase [Marinimicrococcus flavescens]|uniref:GNAT family N-acetyltransferase n=1 Tax=Marinimicrococcus flavescens TaxID=3031815 RepID=A0AAP3UXD6_9PROT|nr:GNAT family N-acetyltransferase [Marinimicrococcus flavescens]
MADPALVRRIERAALWAWPPREVRHLGGWLLRASGGLIRRTNSVQPLAFEGALEPAVAEAVRWYESRGIQPCFQIADTAQPPGLDAALEKAGWVVLTPSLVMTAPVPAEAADRHATELLHRPAQSVMNALCEPHWQDSQRRERMDILSRIRRPHRFALASVDGEPAAAGLVVVEEDLAGILAMRTQSRFQGTGLGRAALARLLGWAAEEGAKSAWLQVEEDNLPALALYRRFGFETAYRYHYRVRPAG